MISKELIIDQQLAEAAVLGGKMLGGGGGNTIYVRIYERGVEEETMACGTGSTSAAIVCQNLGLVSFPVKDNNQRRSFICEPSG